MKFNDFRNCCMKARFINIRIGDQDLLLLPDITSSDESQACFHAPDRTEGFDYLIRKSDIAKAIPHGNGLKISVLVPADSTDEGGEVVMHEGEPYLRQGATLYFMALVELTRAEALQPA
jgi:hypothetical protein